jgi:hypothetical protein
MVTVLSKSLFSEIVKPCAHSVDGGSSTRTLAMRMFLPVLGASVGRITPAPVGGDNMSDAAFLAATEDHVRVVHEARRIVRQILADGAGLSGQEVLRRLDELVVDASAKAERVTVELVDEAFCRHCGHSITRVGDSA